MNTQVGMERRGGYFQSKVFKRMFLSYTLLILLIFGILIGWTFLSYQREAAGLARQECEQQAGSWVNWMDQQLMQAQMLCSSVNVSESARSVLQTVYVEKKTMNALQLYNMLGELNRIKGTVRSTSLNNLILGFQGESKVFMPGAVCSLEGTCQVLPTSPYFAVSSAAKVLGVKGQQMLLNKEYLIYGESYTGFGSQSSVKGEVLVLIDQDQLLQSLRDRVGDQTSVRIFRRGQVVFEAGTAAGFEMQFTSLADSTVNYVVSVPEIVLHRNLPVSSLIPLALMALASIFSILLTYRITRRYYRPIDAIHRMVRKPDSGLGENPESVRSQNRSRDQGRNPEQRNEFDHILQGISSLIGERNGYRERMVTITPYARQGLLQAAIRGAGHPETLVEEQFTELKRNYFMVGEINAAIIRENAATEQRYRDLQELILSASRNLSGPEMQVAAVPENLQNIFVIAASDEKDGFDDFFYHLFHVLKEEAGDPDTVITIGVSRRESDLDRLSGACLQAQASLGQMLTGGRGAVFFPEDQPREQPGYYFPRDALKQMAKMLKERDLKGLNALLDDIYQRNITKADIPADEARQMVDELYWTMQKALRNTYDLSTTHVRMEPIRDAATIEEIFSYCRQVFAATLEQAQLRQEEIGDTSLEAEICQYLEEHLFDPNLSLNGLADQFGVSAKMVGLICRKRYGQTFLNYVRDRQIHHAAELLRESNRSLEEISAECGFTSVLTFRRNFKAVMGVNPSEYRS